MNQLLDHEWQQLAVNSVDHAARMSAEAIRQATSYYTDPSVLYRPKLSIDGDQWCALYGDNLHDGVAGFGNSPQLAMRAFDIAWTKVLTPSPEVKS